MNYDTECSRLGYTLLKAGTARISKSIARNATKMTIEIKDGKIVIQKAVVG